MIKKKKLKRLKEKKDRKKEFEKKKTILQELINKHKNKIPLNEQFETHFKKIATDSWFNISESSHNSSSNIKFKKKKYDKKVIACKKITLLPTVEQKKLLLSWIDAYQYMYNKTNHLIRKRYYDKDKTITSYYTLRTKFLKDERKKISKSTKIPAHTLDGAIRLVCASYKSALTNMKNGNIKHFKIRYLKKSKESRIFDLEPSFFKKDGFCINHFGEMKNNCNFDYSEIKKECKIHYNSKTERFTLLIPCEKDLHTENKKDFISLDPGIRKFLTGVSGKKVVKVGDNIGKYLRGKVKEINKMRNRKEVPNKVKRKIERRENNKIKNRIDDLHWKTINYLTKDHSNIVIGNWSTKNIGRKGNSKITKVDKQVALRLRYYVFLQRLQYVCEYKRINLNIADESYTSKVCSYCGECNDKLGGSEEFNCKKCKRTVDRDVNGSRNILLKGNIY